MIPRFFGARSFTIFHQLIPNLYDFQDKLNEPGLSRPTYNLWLESVNFVPKWGPIWELDMPLFFSISTTFGAGNLKNYF